MLIKQIDTLNFHINKGIKQNIIVKRRSNGNFVYYLLLFIYIYIYNYTYIQNKTIPYKNSIIENNHYVEYV